MRARKGPPKTSANLTGAVRASAWKPKFVKEKTASEIKATTSKTPVAE